MPQQPNGVATDASSIHQTSRTPNVDQVCDEEIVNHNEHSSGVANGIASGDPQDEFDATESRGIKRKITDPPDWDTKASKSRRAISPPWRKFEAEGPASFVEAGRRKSGRTNALPLELQPQTEKRQTRAAYQSSSREKRRRPISSTTKKIKIEEEGGIGVSPSKFKRLGTNTKSPGTRDVRSNSKPRNQISRSSDDSRIHGQQDLHLTKRTRAQSNRLARQNEVQPLPKPIKSLRLNFRRPPIPVLHPGHIVRRKFKSLRECLHEIDQHKGDDAEGRFSEGRVKRDARILRRLEKAAAPGGILSNDDWLEDEHFGQSEPQASHTHQDFLNTHAVMFSKELHNEKSRHMRIAKHLAHAAAEVWQRRQPKTAEEILAEESKRLRSIHQAAINELHVVWGHIKGEAEKIKKNELEERQHAETNRALSDLRERQRRALAERQQRKSLKDRESASENSEIGPESDIEASGEGITSEDDSEATSSSEGEEENSDAFRDDQLTAEELRKKYENLPDIRLEDDDSIGEASHSDREESDVGESDGSSQNSSSEGDADSESGDASADEDADLSTSLLGFLNPKTRQLLQNCDSSTTESDPKRKHSVTSQPASDKAHSITSSPEEVDEKKVISEMFSSSDDPSRQDTPATTITPKHSDIGSADNNTHDEHSKPNFAHYGNSIQTPIPPLLRGNLRNYQHHGLDWLVGMYEKNDNGILADEMGLGKTIQTIALLAHLATTHEVWGPHLIVVPTSVMLNWEMEFKKWCPGFKILTYYGTQEERKAKRKGWRNVDKFHVCITSYQLALQDEAILKKRRWHYMVLDEAQNIKNFRSQRWQTLLTFKSHARLLLTGTPLQNNLQELWSLLYFLAPEYDSEGNSRFGGLSDFSRMFNQPIEQILENGRDFMDEKGREIVYKLHEVLRPHLLRRLKVDVEKQMPKKYEHVVKCKLSKRQRQLYDGYMRLAGTRETFASGNYMSIINCLMQLRKVCNHPDLFETRQIVTSYAMPKSVVAQYEIKELLVRKRVFDEENYTPQTNLLNLWRINTTQLAWKGLRRLAACQPQESLLQEDSQSLLREGHQILQSSLEILNHRIRELRHDDLLNHFHLTTLASTTRSVYDLDTIDVCTVEKPSYMPQARPKIYRQSGQWYRDTSTSLQELFFLNPAFSTSTDLAVKKFGCITPAVTCEQLVPLTVTRKGMGTVHDFHSQLDHNPFHEAQTRLSIAFPDKGLIQYDCGKLQKLDKLLRDLEKGGHRALIFTQMTKVLDILEQFLNLHGHRYLRLDGATKVEQRQALTDQFNQDPRILTFILSSRSGGLGINLTGADTVIFYDLDWNPAMDKQCQDRCHRIGQTRDVHIYRFVSEGTIEANILRKSNQKRMLDDVVIQEGEFTTDAFNRGFEDEDVDAEANAALDMVLGGKSGRKQEEQAFDQAEDKEDRIAAKEAQKEVVIADQEDFREQKSKSGTPTPATNQEELPESQTKEANEEEDGEEDDRPKLEEYMLRFMLWYIGDMSNHQQPNKSKKKAKKGRGIEFKRKR